LFVLGLYAGGLNVPFSGSLSLLSGLLRADAAIASVIADVGRIVIVVDDRCVVGVVNDGHIDVIHGAIVREVATFPPPAQIANSDVTEAIIHAAIKSDVGSPITAMPVIAAVAPTPVTGCPKNAYTRSQDPSAGNPIIVVDAISPITGSPDVAFARA
jgi:hypothetical protein